MDEISIFEKKILQKFEHFVIFPFIFILFPKLKTRSKLLMWCNYGMILEFCSIRTSRDESPFDDFTRYSPAGPGRDKLKKGRGGGGAPFGGYEKGDDALAYKAQLHHYQQTSELF